MKGVVLDSYQTVKMLIDKTTTKTGLKVFTRIVEKNYPIGENTNANNVEYDRIKQNKILPKLSYEINIKYHII